MVIGSRTGLMTSGDLAGAYPWPRDRPWVRSMTATTLDGAVSGADGRSMSISSAADRAVLAEVRRLSDAVVVGAGTIRAERYRPLVASSRDAAERRALGLAAAPVVVVVSGSLDLPWGEDMFHASTIRPIVVTAEATDERRMDTARRHAELVVLPGASARVDAGAVLAHLRGRGLLRVVCEGGPGLLAQIASGGLLDEVDLTMSPQTTGVGRSTAGVPSPFPVPFTLAHVIADDSFLFTRYVAGGQDQATFLA